ncbi:MAG: PEP-CTERM sorting domain-containing protein [Thermoguttaceae bacterium]
MKRVVMLLAVLALLGTSVASADPITTTNTGPVTVAAKVIGTATNGYGTFDQVELDITAISGNASSTDMVTLLSGGEWFADTGFYVPGTTASLWKSATLGGGANSTGIMFDAQTGKLADGSTPAYRSGQIALNNVYTTIGDSWYNGDSGDNLPVGSALAILWVKQGWSTIKWQDAGANYAAISTVALGTSGSAREAITVTQGVPEPSTLALLCAGLMGLAAYAWRKRK